MNSNGNKRCGHSGRWSCDHSPAHVNNVMMEVAHPTASLVTWVPEIELVYVADEPEHWVQRFVSDSDHRAMEFVGLDRVARNVPAWSADVRLIGDVVLPPVLIVSR